MARIAAIDADGHVQEPADAWQRHLDAKWRAYAPRAVRDELGRKVTDALAVQELTDELGQRLR